MEGYFDIGYFMEGVHERAPSIKKNSGAFALNRRFVASQVATS